MTFYLMCHRRAFLAAQVASIRRHHPSDCIVILRPWESEEHFPEFPVVECGIGRSLLILQSIWRDLPDEPSVFLEWDMVLTRPLPAGNAVNREPDSLGNVLYPSFLSWQSKADVPADYLTAQMDRPFTTEYTTVQQEWIGPADSTYPACAAESHFRVLENGILHFHYGAGYRTQEGISPARQACWNQCMDALDLPHLYAEVPPQKPGLGDMVASGLSAIGITKERVSALVGGDCGCGKRQAIANELGHKYLGLPPGSTG